MYQLHHASVTDKVAVYRFISNDKEEHLCLICKKPAILINPSKGFEDYCSDECKQTLHKQSHLEGMKKVDYSKVDFNARKIKSEATCEKKYGCKNPAQSEIVKEKARKTNRDRRGVDYPCQSKDVMQKRIKTNLATHGCEHGLSSRKVIQKRIDNLLTNKSVTNVFQLNETKIKSKQTNLQKLGVDNPSKSQAIKNKKVQSYIDHFGVTHPSKTKWFHDKIKQTCIEVYGVDSFFKTAQYREAYRTTSIAKYGVDHPSKTKEFQDKVQKTNINKYGVKVAILNKDISAKAKKTLETNYGVSCSLDIPYARENSLKSIYAKTIDKYTPYITPLFTFDEWKNRKINDSRLKWRCHKCSLEFQASLYCGNIPRCLNCYPIVRCFSNAEKEVVDYIKSLNIAIEENTRKIIPPKEIDIYLIDHKLAIEFDGLFWHSESQNIDPNYHSNKTKACNDKGITLIHIFENEWIYKQAIVKSIINSKLGISISKIAARNCVVKQVSKPEAEIFYDANHIQGYVNSKINIGLYYKDELVSCLSFSKPRFNKKYDWEITRYATKLNTQILGGFGKLWKRRPSGSIITYSDKRYFTGNVYSKYMIQLPDTKPAYWYFNSDYQLENRMKYQKHKLQAILPIFDENLTEWENMQLNGYNRIWDCGNYCFEFID